MSRARFWVFVAVTVALWIAVLISAAELVSHLDAGRAPGDEIGKLWLDGKIFS